jgi:hypothetical protein
MRFAADAAPGEWGVVFTNVDPAEPHKQFRFALHVGDAAYTRASPLLACFITVLDGQTAMLWLGADAHAMPRSDVV